MGRRPGHGCSLAPGGKSFLTTLQREHGEQAVQPCHAITGIGPRVPSAILAS
jgi:hypothetical protein